MYCYPIFSLKVAGRIKTHFNVNSEILKNLQNIKNNYWFHLMNIKVTLRRLVTTKNICVFISPILEKSRLTNLVSFVHGRKLCLKAKWN